MPVEDVPISQVPENDTPGTKSMVDVHISKPRLKPNEPNAYKVAPRRSARLDQEKWQKDVVTIVIIDTYVCLNLYPSA